MVDIGHTAQKSLVRAGLPKQHQHYQCSGVQRGTGSEKGKALVSQREGGEEPRLLLAASPGFQEAPALSQATLSPTQQFPFERLQPEVAPGGPPGMCARSLAPPHFLPSSLSWVC